MTNTFVEDVRQTCLICGRDCSNKRSLGNHLARSHREVDGLKGYTLKFLLGGSVPLCACGCGKEVSWHRVFYRFNTYVNGHNEAGFKTKQPEFTLEQIEKRSAKIRDTYETRGDEIKKKISERVSETLSTEDVKSKISEIRKSQWKDESYKKKQHNSRVASWQGEAGEKRRAAVFTSEFGKKISVANMYRGVNRVSVAETAFVEKLRSIGLTVEQSKWFNFEDKTWCADAWLSETKTIVEFDGVYWHGFDREEDFTIDQVVNLTNDLKKNCIAREKSLNLVRVREDVDFSSVSSLDDLKAVAHHVVEAGHVVKEGSPRIGDATPLFSRDTIVMETLDREFGRKYVEENYLELTEDFLRAHVEYWGWFYPPPTGDLSSVLDGLGRVDKLNSCTFGSSWLKSRVKCFWDVDNGPAQSFHDPKALRSSVAYRLGLNSSKPYTYDLRDGRTVTCQETFNITLKDIRTGFVVQRKKVSWFKPAWATFVYKKHLNGIKRPVVWDPSVGFSARLLGFAGAVSSGTYVGTDPSSRMIRDAKIVSREISSLHPDLKFEFHEVGSEKFTPEEASLDLVFTSPPYFDTEKYYDEPGQCWRDFPQIDAWIEGYLKPTMKNAHFGLKKTGKMVIDVSPKFRDVVVSSAVSAGFSLIDEDNLDMVRDHFSRENGSAGKSEVFLTFAKT